MGGLDIGAGAARRTVRHEREPWIDLVHGEPASAKRSGHQPHARALPERRDGIQSGCWAGAKQGDAAEEIAQLSGVGAQTLPRLPELDPWKPRKPVCDLVVDRLELGLDRV